MVGSMTHPTHKYKWNGHICLYVILCRYYQQPRHPQAIIPLHIHGLLFPQTRLIRRCGPPVDGNVQVPFPFLPPLPRYVDVVACHPSQLGYPFEISRCPFPPPPAKSLPLLD